MYRSQYVRLALFALAVLLGLQPSRAQQGDTMKTVELKEIVVEGSTVKDYVTSMSAAGTRLPLPLIKTPQSIQGINHLVIQDQQAQNLNDVVKNLTNAISNSMYTSYTMRGFLNSYNNQFITFDGFLGNMYWWNQMVQLYNIETVEEISGPASALFSTGSPGGVINMVTKKPLEAATYTFNVTSGSWGLVDAAADLGGPLTETKNLRYRLNVGFNRQDSFRPYQFNDNLMVAPSLQFSAGERTTIILDYVKAYNRTRFVEDHGGLLLMNRDSTYDWNNVNTKFLFNSPGDYGNIDNNSLTLRVTHEFSQDFAVTLMSRSIWSVLNQGEHYGDYYANNYFTSLPDSMQRAYDTWVYNSYNFQNSLVATYAFEHGFIHHTIVGGVDFQLYGDSKNRYINGPAPAVSFSNPDYSNDNFNYPIDANTYVWDVKSSNRQVGVYLQDLIGISDNIKLLIAVRYENFRFLLKPNSADTYVTNDTSTAEIVLPRFGAVYELDRNNSVYGSYCESFTPQYDNIRSAGGPFPPERGKQYEIGYKGIHLGGELLTTAAYYHIDYVNILAVDPADPSGVRQIVVPGLTSSGVEVTLQGNIGRLSLIGGYAYNHVVFSDNSPLGPKGGRYDNSANHIANAWIKYSLPENSSFPNLGLSAGAKYVGDRVGIATNQHFLMPAYLTLDAGLSVPIGRYTVALNGYNVLDKKYVLGYYASDLMVQVGPPVNWKLNLSYAIR